MKFTKLIASVFMAELVGFLGSLFMSSATILSWYDPLQKPAFNPPDWVFGPVWLALYGAMGVAAYFVWKKKAHPLRVRALTVYGIQLALNFGWTALFFGLRNPLLALIEIVALWLAIFYTIILFRKISYNAAILLIPYLVWVSFAFVLNFAIWQLN